MNKVDISIDGKRDSGSVSFSITLELPEEFSLAGNSDDVKISLKQAVIANRADIYSKHRIKDFDIRTWRVTKIEKPKASKPSTSQKNTKSNGEKSSSLIALKNPFGKPYYWIPFRLVWFAISLFLWFLIGIIKIFEFA